ncbi:transcriptional regulator [Streptomyces sulfonofaciens]|uniref:Transcriptional regulator n=1 Tax=Streptomyces sulfonofaciens TaxID=68272 RepID=A0A919G3C0_9ACTN|nr:TetR/AcrR family transcriptional regulator [Streptomyces sulfonofaciens]GHH76894.1 transcriptional regulator [Streptomyces sulfonofaciens]
MGVQRGKEETARLTARGRVTRTRIVETAAELMRVKGVNATTLDEVRAASGTSKSQLYRHFPDRDALVHEVVEFQASKRLDDQRRLLRRLDSIRGLERWRDAIVGHTALHGGAYGCPMGSLANELADHDDDARSALAEFFEDWEELLHSGLERMRHNGELRPDADPRALATALMAAVQGGYVLARTTRDASPMRTALNMAIAHVRTFTPKV